MRVSMELTILICVLLVSAYPYLLLLRLMRLACKALKCYIEQQKKADYRYAEE